MSAHITLFGRVTRIYQNDVSNRMSFSVAVNHRKKVNPSDQYAPSDFYRVTSWGDGTVSFLLANLLVGQKVVVSGTLEHNTFDKRDGSVGYSNEVSANSVEIAIWEGAQQTAETAAAIDPITAQAAESLPDFRRDASAATPIPDDDLPF